MLLKIIQKVLSYLYGFHYSEWFFSGYSSLLLFTKINISEFKLDLRDVVKEDPLYGCTSISYLSNLVAYNDAVAASLCLLRVKCQTFHGGDDIFNFHPGHRGHGRHRGNRVTAITRGSKNKTSAALK